MSAALPYLRALRKSDLVTLAELSDMKDFADMKKTELEAALDSHLSQNKNRLASESKLSDYYERLARPPRGSPIKKEPKVEVTSFDGSSSVKRSTRRRSVKPKEEVEATDDSDESSPKSSPAPEPAPVATQTPSRPAIKFPSLPPSPAVVTDAIDRQTTRVRKSVSEAWDQSGMTERTHSLRSLLSSTSTIQTLILILELSSVINAIMPWRKFTFPAIEALNTSACTHNIPDLFNTFQPAFWSPLLLWASTSVVLPSIIAYFFDINLKMSQSTSPTTRRSAAVAAAQDKGKVCGDPLVFNVAKALIASIVYGSGFNFWNLFSQTSVLKVVSAVPWGLQGLLTGSAICTLGSLYEAILRK